MTISDRDLIIRNGTAAVAAQDTASVECIDVGVGAARDERSRWAQALTSGRYLMRCGRQSAPTVRHDCDQIDIVIADGFCDFIRAAEPA